ncbi:MAG: type III-A CRISPR-associated protein Cas10/Csm1 [Armatimonadota bacterium]|nr:type III-A CRISPR-associated protein Cas10/Csm1 [bacterium]MDW8321827.1 type III-A CRISPR-associated protein Cas10/Csm1 [Armatimonadota bacterium]
MQDWELDLWLAALFHDAGKVSQRFGGDYRQKHAAMSEDFIRSLTAYLGAERAQRVARLAGAHHDTPTDRLQRLLHAADKLAALERQTERRVQLDSDEAALVSVASRVEFREARGAERFHSLTPLGLEMAGLFPEDSPRVREGQYGLLWNSFVQEINSLSPFRPTDLQTLLSLLRKYWVFVPSATPWEQTEERTVPDVSLYDHTKVVTAIAACLGKLGEESLPDARLEQLIHLLRRFSQEEMLSALEQLERNYSPLARFVRFDIGGIQTFLFRVARPEADTDGVARRLRGRSFWVSVLAQATADWLVRRCEVTPANILFCGGGSLDLLLPATEPAMEAAREVHHALDQYLLQVSGGLLSLQGAMVDLWAHDFARFGDVYERAASQLAVAKHRRSYWLIRREPEDFFAPEQQAYRLCPSCTIVPIEGEGLCKHCQRHESVGRKLPRTHSLAFVWDEAYRPRYEALFFEPMGLWVELLSAEERLQLLQNPPSAECVLVCLNDTDEFLSPRGEAEVGFRFQFVANSVPTREGNLLSFDDIAKLGDGAARLGVLKMDVDYLGAVFSMGVEPPTVSRLSTLSSAFEMFFGGWLNQLCRQVSAQWGEELSVPLQVDLISGVFYTLYAGGDDLFVIGPWEATIHLAQAVRRDFRRFVGENPNLTLSGGLVCVKPKFPVPRFAELVDEALTHAKRGRRDDPLGRGDHLCLFHTVVSWSEAEDLTTFARDLYQAIREKRIARGFIYFLLRLHEEFFRDAGKADLRWIPRFHYQLARRVSPEVVAQLQLSQRTARAMPYMRVPVSIVSLKMREEG